MLFSVNTLRTHMLRGWTILTLTVCLLAAPLLAAPLSNDDREHLLVHFEMTTQMVAELVQGLSPAQLEYKASPDRWSIREVVSHLAVAEPDYWRDLQKALRAAPDMNTKKSVATDAEMTIGDFFCGLRGVGEFFDEAVDVDVVVADAVHLGEMQTHR